MAKKNKTDLTQEEAIKMLNGLFAKFADDVDKIRKNAIEDINGIIKEIDRKELKGLRDSLRG